MAELTQEQKFKFRQRAEEEAAAGQETAPKEEYRTQTANEMAETMFGKGVDPNISLTGRMKRIGEAGLAGGGVGAAVGGVIGAGAGGVGAVPGALTGAGIGIVGGALSEVAGQATEAFGGGRAAQVLSELVGGGFSEGTVSLVKNFPTIARMLGSAIAPGPTRIYQGFKGMVSDAGTAPASKPVQEALRGFQPSETAATKVGGAIQDTARVEGEMAKKAAMAAEQADTLAARQKAQAETVRLQQAADKKVQLANARKALEAKTEQQRAIEAASKQSTVAEMRATAGQEESMLREKAVRAKEGLGEPPPTEELGAKIQSDVLATKKPLYEARSENYDKAYTSAVESAASKEAAGGHFAATEDFAKVDKYWRDQIKKGKMTEAQAVEIEKVLNEIKFGRGNKPITEAGIEIGRTPPEPKSLEGVDAYLRQLADKGFLEAEGGKAIGVQKAKELRQTLLYGVDGSPDAVKGGLYAWEPKLQEAKALYRQDSEGLKAYRTEQGKSVTAFEQDVKDRPKVEALKVPDQYFKSAQGVKDLTAQLGGDSVKAGEYATQHAMKQLEGKDAKATAKWIDDKKQDWMDAVPGLREKLGKYQSSLAQTETGAATSKTQIAAAEKSVAKADIPPTVRLAETKQVPDVKPEPVKNWSSRVDETTKARLKIAGVEDSVTPTNARQVFSDILASKQSDAQMRAIGYYIKMDPEATAAVADAVRDHLSGRTGKGTLETWNSQVLPALESSGLVPKADMKALKKDILKLEAALAADKGLSSSAKKIEFAKGTRDVLLRFLGRTPITGRLPSDTEE